jgi:predicted nucleic acid-binding protein
LAEEGRSAKINDLSIAEVAAANGLDIVSRNNDFDSIEMVGGPAVIRV